MEILSKDNIRKYDFTLFTKGTPSIGSCRKSLYPDFMMEIVSAILY